ncbi:MAG: hypothetical protein WDA06_15680 [Phenylobacterium sp.]
MKQIVTRGIFRILESQADLKKIDIEEYEEKNNEFDNLVDDLNETESAGSIDEIPESQLSFGSVFEAIDYAEKHQETIRISYITLSGINITRDIEPHKRKFSNKKHRTVVTAWDTTVNGIRSFIVRNIIDTAFLNIKFSKKF